MKLAIILHTLIEAAVGILFLAYAGATDLVPGFAAGEGASYQMLLHMYGVAALFLAAVGVYLIKLINEGKAQQTISLLGMLCLFHLGMAIIQLRENPDSRAALLHFLLLILLGSAFTRLKVPVEEEA